MLGQAIETVYQMEIAMQEINADAEAAKRLVVGLLPAGVNILAETPNNKRYIVYVDGEGEDAELLISPIEHTLAEFSQVLEAA